MIATPRLIPSTRITVLRRVLRRLRWRVRVYSSPRKLGMLQEQEGEIWAGFVWVVVGVVASIGLPASLPV